MKSYMPVFSFSLFNNIAHLNVTTKNCHCIDKKGVRKLYKDCSEIRFCLIFFILTWDS